MVHLFEVEGSDIGAHFQSQMMKTSEDQQRKAATGWKAGAARNEITTQENGTRVLDPLFARALVLTVEATTLAIVTMDVTAIGGICDVNDTFLPGLRERVERQLGIPGSRLLVNASHTHPPGEILCDEATLLERTFDAIRRAQENQVAATVGIGSGFEDGITMNRNLRLADGTHWTIRHAYPSPPDEAVAGIGRIDPEVGVIRIDHTDGTSLAVVYHFACHLLFGDAEGSVTANFPATASRIIEESCGGAMAFFLQGAAGDVIDVSFKDFLRPREVESHGVRLGLAVLREWRRIVPGPAVLKVITETVALPRRTDLGDRIARLEKERDEWVDTLRFTSLNFRDFLLLYHRHLAHPDFPGGPSYEYLREAALGNERRKQMDRFNEENLRKYLENIRAMERLARLCDELATLRRHLEINRESGSPTVTTELQAIRLGEATLLAAPLEVLTEVALKLKAAAPRRPLWIAGFSNGYLHYGPPAADYDKRGYEVTECFLAPEWEALFEAKVHEMLARL